MARNPQKVVDAVAAAGVRCGKIELREFTAATAVLIQKIDSPLVRVGAAGQHVEMTNMDVLRLVFVLSRPAEESFRTLRGGMEEFDAAVMACADGILIAELPAIGKAINELFARAMSTAPAQGGPDGKKNAGESTSAMPPSS